MVSKPSKSRTNTSGNAVKFGLGGVAVLILLGFVALRTDRGRQWLARQTAGPALVAPKTKSGVVHEGDEATITAPGAKAIYLVVDENDWNTMLDAEAATDPSALKLLIEKGKVIVEAPGTTVKALKRSSAATKVRIRGGNHPGAEGWIQFDYLHPIP